MQRNFTRSSDTLQRLSYVPMFSNAARPRARHSSLVTHGLLPVHLNTSRTHHPVHLSSGGLHSSPRPAKTRLSAVNMSGAFPYPPSSRSTQDPSARLRMPLLSNLRHLSLLQYRRRSRCTVVPLVQPRTAQPAVFQ